MSPRREADDTDSPRFRSHLRDGRNTRGMPPEPPRSGSGPRARLPALDFAAQSCDLCQRACAAAMARLSDEGTAAMASPLLDALGSCRRLMWINADLLRERSPL